MRGVLSYLMMIAALSSIAARVEATTLDFSGVSFHSTSPRGFYQGPCCAVQVANSTGHMVAYDGLQFTQGPSLSPNGPDYFYVGAPALPQELAPASEAFYNLDGYDAYFWNTTTPFVFNSMVFGAFPGNFTVDVTGKNNGAVVDAATLTFGFTSCTTLATCAAKEVFNWTNLTEVDFEFHQRQYTLSDIEINDPVAAPEPGTAVGLLVGLVLCCLLPRKIQNRQAWRR